MIRYRTDTAYPTDYMDRTAVKNGNDGKFVNSPRSNDAFDHTELQNGTTYYYSAFTYDEVPLTIPKLTHFSSRHFWVKFD